MVGDRQRWWRRRRPARDAVPSDVSESAAQARSGRPAVEPDDGASWPVTGDRARPSTTDAGSDGPAEPSAEASNDPAVLDRLADYVRVQVRSGVHDIAALKALTLQAAQAEIDEPAGADETARVILSEEITSWHTDAAQWVGRTDPERLDRTLERLGRQGMLTLPALEDVEVLAETVRIRGCPDGAVAYLVADVWHALDDNELPLAVIDRHGQPASRSGPLVALVMDTLAEEGLLGVAGRGDAASVVVTLNWRRHPDR